jgi:hypothetical protein
MVRSKHRPLTSTDAKRRLPRADQQLTLGSWLRGHPGQGFFVTAALVGYLLGSSPQERRRILSAILDPYIPPPHRDAGQRMPRVPAARDPANAPETEY